MRVVVLLVSLALLGIGSAAQAQPVGPVELCRLADKRIGELSGFATDDKRWYAVNDGGTKITVWVLGTNCGVQRSITNATDPVDVEDMALASDGSLWLADIGDNRKRRDTVAMHKVTPDGKAVLYRLSYPDGPKDAEALLLGRDGVPLVVTKEALGSAQVYRPAGELRSPGPTPLVKVTEVNLRSTDTPGGPTNVPRSISSSVVTGGAVSADGTVVALRTYTDAYLYSAPDGDIAAALGRDPLRVPLPNEPQGEAIAFSPNGDLLSASEGVGQPIRVVAGAAARVPKAVSADRPDGAPADSGAGAAPATSSSGGIPVLPGIGVAVLVLGLFVLVGRRRRRG
jgi:hypothetical protein